MAYYRKAIEADPRLWSARSELGISLMRLGQTDEPLQQLEMCYDNGYRDAATVNSLRLLDSFKNFLTFTDSTSIIKLHKKEADLLLPYVQPEVDRAIATYTKKYKMKMPGPRASRTLSRSRGFRRAHARPCPASAPFWALPSASSLAMDSPSGRPPGTYQWGSTLWHEMSHVFILTATNHRVPRWFTEGLSVHEETQVSPGMGRPRDAGNPARRSR